MFIQELKKLFKTGIMPATLLICAVMVTILCVAFAQTFDFGKSYRSYGIESYDNREEIIVLIDETQDLLENAQYRLETQRLTDEEKNELKEEISTYKRAVNVYDYLYENDIAYTDYSDYGGIRAQRKDSAFCAFTWLTQICSFALPLITGMAAAILMPWDFHSGTYKYLYSSSTPRKKFIFTRYFVWLAAATCTGIILCTACALLGLMYGSAAGIIIYATASAAFGLNYFGTVALETACILFKVLTVGTAVFGCSMLAKNVVLPIAVNIAICACAIGLSVYCASVCTHPFLYILANGIMGAFAFIGTSWVTILLNILLSFAVAIIVFVGGYMRLNYRNIN